MSAANLGFLPPPLAGMAGMTGAAGMPGTGAMPGAGMVQMLAQMMWWPFSMLVRCMDGIGSAMGTSLPQGRQGAAAANHSEATAPGTNSPESETNRLKPSWAQGDGATRQVKEERKMSDCHCCDNDHGTVKLVEYTIVSVKRCAERILKRGEVIESEEMSPEAFATWVVAMYLQDEDEEDIPHEDKKYLRVYHNTLQSWPRQGKDCCSDREVDVLRGIEEAIRNLRPHEGGEERHHAEPPPPPHAPGRGRQAAAAAG